MKTTHIPYVDHTFNPWAGCSKVSAGCANCYAERIWARMKLAPGERRRTSAANWCTPLAWNKHHLVCPNCGPGTRIQAEHETGMPWCSVCGNYIEPRRPRVLCGSICDVFDRDAPGQWRHDLWQLIAQTQALDWLLLTKRPEWISQCWPNAWWDRPPPNVWLGVTAEDQMSWDRRVSTLLSVTAAKRWVSIEPMLEEIDMHLPYPEHDEDLSIYGRDAPDWIVVGGESGPKARPCSIEWIRDVVKQCRKAQVPVYVKQLGADPYWTDEYNGLNYNLYLTDKKGGDPAEWPEDLRVREVA